MSKIFVENVTNITGRQKRMPDWKDKPRSWVRKVIIIKILISISTINLWIQCKFNKKISSCDSKVITKIQGAKKINVTWKNNKSETSSTSSINNSGITGFPGY